MVAASTLIGRRLTASTCRDRPALSDAILRNAETAITVREQRNEEAKRSG